MSAKKESNYLNILITNPFDEQMPLEKGTGFGLKSIKRRLFLLYGRNDLLKTEVNKNEFIVNLRIPQKHDQVNNS